MNLIHGEAVTVYRSAQKFDDLGELIESGTAAEKVYPVVVKPGKTEDLDASRPSGVEVAFSLSFPKAYKKNLRGCVVEVRGQRCRVVGDPQRYTPENTPNAWNLTVEVERVNG